MSAEGWPLAAGTLGIGFGQQGHWGLALAFATLVGIIEGMGGQG